MVANDDSNHEIGAYVTENLDQFHTFVGSYVDKSIEKKEDFKASPIEGLEKEENLDLGNDSQGQNYKSGNRISCKFCMKSFSCQNRQKRHERMPIGEKPFSCKVCKKHFLHILQENGFSPVWVLSCLFCLFWHEKDFIQNLQLILFSDL